MRYAVSSPQVDFGSGPLNPSVCMPYIPSGFFNASHGSEYNNSKILWFSDCGNRITPTGVGFRYEIPENNPSDGVRHYKKLTAVFILNTDNGEVD